MKFVPYHLLDDSPNIIVDGAAGRGTVLTLSHWPKSGTPGHLKRDTSAAIVFAYLDSPSCHVQADVVSNNHFDDDGLIGIFTLVDTVTAHKYRELLLDAASAGDFGVFKSRDAARIAFTIRAYTDSEISPLSAEIFALPYLEMAGQYYEQLLELMPSFLANINEYEQHWKVEDKMLAASEKLIENGRITIEERPDLDLAIVRIPSDLKAEFVHEFTQKYMAECHPFAVNSRTSCTRLLTIRGPHVEFQYRYETWVQLVSRRPPLRVDLKALAEELNQSETSGGCWVFDGVEQMSPRLHLKGADETSLAAADIQERLERYLLIGPAIWDPFD